MLDPNAYSLARLHSFRIYFSQEFSAYFIRSLRDIYGLIVVSISHFRFVSRSGSFASYSSVHFVTFFASGSKFSYQRPTNANVVFAEVLFTII